MLLMVVDDVPDRIEDYPEWSHIPVTCMPLKVLVDAAQKSYDEQQKLVDSLPVVPPAVQEELDIRKKALDEARQNLENCLRPYRCRWIMAQLKGLDNLIAALERELTGRQKDPPPRRKDVVMHELKWNRKVRIIFVLAAKILACGYNRSR